MTKELIERAFKQAEMDYRYTLGRVKYFYNRGEFDRIPWERLNKNDDIMNLAIIEMTKIDFNSEKRKARVLERMVNTYNNLDEKRANFF